jgi:hypothetical protein
MSECNPCDAAANLPAEGMPCAPTCAEMMCRAVIGYNAIINAMMSGNRVAEAKFGEETVKYAATSETSNFLMTTIRNLHKTCPSEASAALLGIGAASGPIGVRFGCSPVVRFGC